MHVLPRSAHNHGYAKVAGEESSVLRTDTNMELLGNVRTGRLLIAKVYLGASSIRRILICY